MVSLQKTPATGIRETLRKYPILAFVGVVIAAGSIYFGVHSARDVEPTGIQSSYFSIDDGKSYFSDDSTLIPPFDHHGSPAVRAHVFIGNDGKKFVGYLERITPAGAEIIRKMQKRKPTDPPLSMGEMGAVLGGHEYKRPGDKQWVNGGVATEASRIKSILAADGSPLTEVDE